MYIRLLWEKSLCDYWSRKEKNEEVSLMGTWKKSGRKSMCKGPVERTHLARMGALRVWWWSGVRMNRRGRGAGGQLIKWRLWHFLWMRWEVIGTLSAEGWQDESDVLKGSLQLLCDKQIGMRKGGG